MLRYRLLGSLTVERDGVVLELGTPKQRALLAVLAQEAGSTVSVDRIVDQVWSDDPPPTVQSSLHANISRLRRLLRDDPSAPPPIARRSGGYVLDVDRAEVDVQLFLRAAGEAAAAVDRRDWRSAVAAATSALDLWRGGYLDDLRDQEWVRVAAAPLAERRSGAVIDLISGLLGTGDTAAALARSTALNAEQPLVERAAWLHMMALYQAGRSAEALETYRAYTARLDEELGLDPGTALRDLHGAILRQDPETARWPGRTVDERSPTAAPGLAEAPAPPPAVAPEPVVASHEPLIGRAAELAEAAAVLAGARTDGARWLVISGPAGMGKTRLAEELIARWTADGGKVVRGQCPDLHDIPSWWPIRQVVRDLGADPDAILAPVAGGEVDFARFAVVERAVAVVRARLTTPLLVVIDDIHWSDRASLGFLTMLAETVPGPGLAVVLTTRLTRGRPELDHLLAALVRRPGSRQIVLPALSVDEVAQLVEQVSGDRPAQPDAARLATRTGGTPFYVTEYARLPSDERSGDHIPTAVRAVLRRRFTDLPPDLLDALHVAAVLGDPLDARLVAGVVRRDADTVADLLDDAADLDLLTSALDTAAYSFSHALLREELAAAVPDMRRRRMHLRAAELLAHTTGLTATTRRARHLHAAAPLADPVLAYPAFRLAAQGADERWLSERAAVWWGAAAEAYERTPEPDADVREQIVAARVRAIAHAGQGQTLLDVLNAALIEALRAGRLASVGRLAANLLRVSGSWPWPVYGADLDPLMNTLAALDPALADDPGARARVLAAAAVGLCYHPDPAVPDRLSLRAIELAEHVGDDAVLADALFGRALTYSGITSHAVESIELSERLAALRYDGREADDVLRRNIVSMALMNVGRMVECAEQVRAGALGADVMRMPINRVQLRWAEASLALWDGDLRRGAELVQRAGEAHRRTELQQSGTFELMELTLRWTEGRLALFPGPTPTNPMVSQWTTVVADAAAGRPGCDDALAAEVRRFEPDIWTSSARRALLAHCVADRGLVELAGPLLDGLRPVQDCFAAMGQCGAIGPVGLAMARLSRLAGDHAAAREQLAAATDLCELHGAAALLLHCRLEARRWAVEDGVAMPDDLAELDAVGREADGRAMPGVAQRARDLAARARDSAASQS